MADQQRVVTIRKADGFDTYMSDHHGTTALHNAIGYLSQWNMWENRFDIVQLVCCLNKPGEQPHIAAKYKSSAHPDAMFFIMAMFHPQSSPNDEHPNGQLARFSFHS